MHRTVDAIIEIARRDRGLELDAPDARLALLIVIERLADVLCEADLAALHDALPLGLSVMLVRRGERDPVRPSYEPMDDAQVWSVCAALARHLDVDLGRRMRDVVPPMLRLRASGVIPRLGPGGHEHPTEPAEAPSSRPTVRPPLRTRDQRADRE